MESGRCTDMKKYLIKSAACVLFILTWDSCALALSTITLTDCANGRVVQRDTATNTGSITISGTYTGTATPIEARIVLDGTSTEAVTWTQIVASPTGGTFSGTLTGIPSGGWYNIQVRDANNTGITSNGTNKIGIGILILFTGQSNAAGVARKKVPNTGCDPGITLEAISPLARIYFNGNAQAAGANTNWCTLDGTQTDNGDGWVSLPAAPATALDAGAGVIRLCNSLIEYYDCPVGILEYSVGGSAMTYWNGGAYYTTAVNNTILWGGKVEYIFWWQGESEAMMGGDAAYATKEASVFSAFRTAFSQPTLPIISCYLGPQNGGWDAGYAQINSQKTTHAGLDANMYMITTSDIAACDLAHYTGRAYRAVADRAVTIIKLTSPASPPTVIIRGTHGAVTVRNGGIR